MQNSQSFSQPYSQEFQSVGQFEEDINDEQQAGYLQQELIKQNKKSSGQITYSGDLKVKLPFQGKQTQETSALTTTNNQVNVNLLNNRFLVPKRTRPSIGSQNIDRKQFIQKLAANSQAAMGYQDHQKLPNLVQAVPNNQTNQFKRSRATNNRRSLHIVMSDKKIEESQNQKEYLFVKNKIKSITSHVSSARRYPVEDQNIENNGVSSSLNPSNSIERQAIVRRTREKLNFLSGRVINSPKSRSHNKSLNQITSKDEIIYKEPERNSQRVVVFIKTYILSQFQSISLEISVLDGAIVIVGKMLGQEMDTLKLVLNQERSEKVLADSFGDWEILGKRIYVEANESGVKKLKIAPMKSVVSTMIKQQNSEDLQQSPSATLSSKKTNQKNLLFIKQTQFLQRNYYSLKSRHDQTLNTREQSSINGTNENTIDHNQNKNLGEKGLEKRERSPQGIDLKEHLAKHNKHLDYLSPDIKQKAEEYKQEKQRSLNKELVRKQLEEREALAKRQQEQIQRLSKPKETIKSKSKDNLGSKTRANNDRSMSKDRKFNLRATVNKKITQNIDQKTVQIRSSSKHEDVKKSTNLKDAQSKIQIKMSHFEAQKHDTYNKSKKMDSSKPFTSSKNNKSKASINSEKELPDWKEVHLQKTESIEQLKARGDDMNSSENYSEFESEVENVNKKVEEGEVEGDEIYEYEDDDFEQQPVSAKHSKASKNNVEMKENKSTQSIILDSNKQKSSQSISILKANKLIPEKVQAAEINKNAFKKEPKTAKDQLTPKQPLISVKQNPKVTKKPQEVSQDEVLIRDVDQEEYAESFDQFKQERPNDSKTGSKQNMAKNQSETQLNQKSQVYSDSFQNQRYVDSLKEDEFELSQTKQPNEKPNKKTQQKQYEQEIELQEDDGEYENILQENDLLDDQQVINKIEEDQYLDQDFDN